MSRGRAVLVLAALLAAVACGVRGPPHPPKPDGPPQPVSTDGGTPEARP
jgi:predicted small lipoprotein YifL